MITSVTTNRVGINTRRVTAISDLSDPIFRFYIAGQLYAEQVLNWIDVTAGSGPVPVDVFDQDEPDALPAPSAVVGLRLSFEPPPGLASYRIERLSGASWVAVATLAATSNRGVSYTVEGLADVTRHRLRAVGIGPDASETILATRAALLIRTPDIPPQGYTVSGGTLSAGVA